MTEPTSWLLARRVRLGAAVALSCVGLSGLTAERADAHAVLEHTLPERGAELDAVPGSVEFEFSEPVEVSFGAVRVFNEKGDRVDEGAVLRPEGSHTVGVALRSGLAKGIYIATYRVVSADGHPVSGGFSFGVGTPVAIGHSTPLVADLLESSKGDRPVEGAYGTVRGLHYLALLLLVGSLAFGLAVWPRKTSRRWPRRLLAAAAVLGLVSSLAGVALQGALGAGVSLRHALDRGVIDGSLSTHVGEVWSWRVLAWAVVLVVVLSIAAPRRWLLVLLLVPVLVLVGLMPYGGHAQTQSPRWLLIPADVLHIVGAGTWLGGLILLLVVFWPRRGVAADDDVVHATSRFSLIALPAVVVLVGAGTVQAWFYIGSVGAVFDSLYGWALLAKIGLLALVVGLASGNRRRVARISSGDGDAGRALRTSMLAEVGLAVLVLAATAILVRAAPPVAAANGPVVRQLDLGSMHLEMDVEPARVGANDYHLYFFDRKTGAQVDRVDEVVIQLTQPDRDIGPITLAIPRKGVAHYELTGAALGVPGTWHAQVQVRQGEFDLYTADTTFKVRG